MNHKGARGVHIRVKRQYFKPSIDGSWLANERTITLKSNKHNQMIFDLPPSATNEPVSTSTFKPVQQQIVYNSNNNNNIKNPSANATNPKNEITVANLAISLISLFDRIKCTLYNVINQECKN